MALPVCPTSPLRLRDSAEPRPNLELASGKQITKTRGACALTRAGGSLYTIKLKSACRKPDLSLSGSDPVSLSKMETDLLASLGSKGKIRNSLACLRNAGFHSAVTYCIGTSSVDIMLVCRPRLSRKRAPKTVVQLQQYARLHGRQHVQQLPPHCPCLRRGISISCA